MASTGLQADLEAQSTVWFLAKSLEAAAFDQRASDSILMEFSDRPTGTNRFAAASRPVVLLSQQTFLVS